MRAALHQAGAAALTALLQFEAPATEQRQLAIGCGHHAIPGNPLQTHLVSRPCYLCSRCHAGQFPVVELDIENTEFSPGVHRMQATAGGRTEPSDNQYSITPLDRHEVGKKVDEKVPSSGEVGKPSFT